MSTDPAFDAVRDAARQLIAASRALLDAVEEVVDDDERVAKVSDAVHRGFAAAGIDLERLRGGPGSPPNDDESSRVHRIDVE